MEYIRNAKTALNMGAGLSWEERGVLSMMIDLMMVHENRGIPVQPKSYISGMLGIGQKKWSQTIEPKLLAAKKIRITTRDGIEVYVWADPDLARRPKDVARPAPVEATIMQAKDGDKFSRGLRFPGAWPVTDAHIEIKNEEGATVEVPVKKPAPYVPTGTMDDDPRPVKPAPELIPEPSPMDVLRRAGVDVDEHPKGPFFWARADHRDSLRKWLQSVPLNEITARIAKAVQSGQADAHPNTMQHYERFVLGPIK